MSSTNRFSVALIPHTLENTTLGRLESRRARQPRNRPPRQVRRAAARIARRRLLPWPDRASFAARSGPKSMPTAARQTQSFLMQRFEEAGIRPEIAARAEFSDRPESARRAARSGRRLGPRRCRAGGGHGPGLADQPDGADWRLPWSRSRSIRGMFQLAVRRTGRVCRT